MKLAQKISQTFIARKNCIESGNKVWEDKHSETLEALEKLLPSGSGFDSGTKITDASDRQIKLRTKYHHMSPEGFYTHWTQHCVTIKSTFSGLDVTVSGSGDICDYIAEVFEHVLSESYDESVI